jgi:hypothetical protein
MPAAMIRCTHTRHNTLHAPVHAGIAVRNDPEGNDYRGNIAQIAKCTKRYALQRVEFFTYGVGMEFLDPFKAGWLKSGKSVNVSLVEPEKQAMYYEGGFFLPKSQLSNTAAASTAPSSYSYGVWRTEIECG